MLIGASSAAAGAPCPRSRPCQLSGISSNWRRHADLGVTLHSLGRSGIWMFGKDMGMEDREMEN